MRITGCTLPSPQGSGAQPSPPHPTVQMFFPVGNKAPKTQLPSFLHVALGREGPWREERAPGQGGGTEASLGRRILLPPRPREPVEGVSNSAMRSGGAGHPQGQGSAPGPAMDSAAKDEMQPALLPGMSPLGGLWEGWWQERWEWCGWVLPARSGWSSVG